MDLCVHFGKPAFILFISSLYLYFVFQINIFQFNSIPADIRACTFYCSFTRQVRTFYFNAF